MKGRPTWILIRGLARESGHWGPFLPALTAAMPDADVVALDLPGTGARLRERAPATMTETMEAVRDEAASRLAPGTPRLIFGISLGGMVAMEWAGRHPEELAGVVVAASSAPAVAPVWRRMSLRGFAMIGMSRFTRDPEKRQARLARLVVNRRDLREEAVRSWVQIERERPVTPDTLRRQMGAAARWRAPEKLGVPSLFLVGGKDRLVHPECSRALARRYAAPLVEHPEAGHDLTTDATPWVVEEMVRFRRGLSGSPA